MEKINLSFANLERVQPYNFLEFIDKGKEYVSYGEDNLFPDKLWDLYINNSYHQSIIDSIVEYVLGQGIETTVKLDELEDVIKKAAFDFYLFGGFAIQKIMNRGGGYTLHNLDFMKVRVDEDETVAYYSKTWGKYAQLTKAKKYPIINKDSENKSGVYYYKGIKTRGVYPLPSYVGSLQALETQIEIQNFHLSSIKNNFAVSAIINFNNGIPDEDTITKIEKQINDKFTGSGSAAKFLLNFNEDKDKATTIERLESDNFDEKFTKLGQDTRNNIYAAHRMQPILCGIYPENQGFSKSEYTEAFEVFNRTIVLRIQKELAVQFDKILNTKNAITFIPFSLDDCNSEVKADDQEINKKEEVINE